jgi:Uma2 family endonuclease
MTTVTALPFSRPLVRADLEDLPENGHRYELVDGTLLVSPGPRWRHQEVLGNLYVRMKARTPADLVTGLAPFAIALADDTELQPDLWVARRADLAEKELPVPPLLAVEVLSPSTRRVDRLLKRDRLQEAGVPSYWLVDPAGPEVTVLELRDGAYAEVAVVGPGEAVELTQPFPVRLEPSALLD